MRALLEHWPDFFRGRTSHRLPLEAGLLRGEMIFCRATGLREPVDNDSTARRDDGTETRALSVDTTAGRCWIDYRPKNRLWADVAEG